MNGCLYRLFIFLLATTVLATLALAQTTAPATKPATKPAAVEADAPPPPPAKPIGTVRALIVIGDPGTDMYARHYQDRSARMIDVLRDAKVDEKNITVLSGIEKPDGTGATKVASSESVLETVSAMASQLGKDDQFILVLFGHGAIAGESPTLMLPGPDLNIADLAKAIGALKCRHQTVLNFSASAGSALPLLAAPGRVNIAGGSVGQVNSNDFAEFFLQQLEANPSATLLEAYNRSTQQFAQWIVRQKLNAGEGASGWIVEGKESAALFRQLYDAPDVPADRKFASSPASSAPDVKDPPLVADQTPHWAMRRIVTEHPSIDDSAKEAPKSALTPTGFVAVAPADAPVAAKVSLVRTK